MGAATKNLALAALGRGDAGRGYGCAGDAQGSDRHRGGVARGSQDSAALLGRRGFLSRLGRGSGRDRLCRGLGLGFHLRLGLGLDLKLRRRLLGIDRGRRGLGRKRQVGAQP